MTRSLKLKNCNMRQVFKNASYTLHPLSLLSASKKKLASFRRFWKDKNFNLPILELFSALEYKTSAPYIFQPSYWLQFTIGIIAQIAASRKFWKIQIAASLRWSYSRHATGQSPQIHRAHNLERITIYGPMIYTAPRIRILMRADG